MRQGVPIYSCTRCQSCYTIRELEEMDWKCEDCGGTNFKSVDPGDKL